jgi:hypothetical protein
VSPASPLLSSNRSRLESAKEAASCSEEDLRESLEAAMDRYPDTYAILVRRHGV